MMSARNIVWSIMLVLGWQSQVQSQEPLSGFTALACEPVCHHEDIRTQITGITGNPAWQLTEQVQREVRLRYDQRASSGSYRRSIDPRSVQEQRVVADGRVIINQVHRFDGYFGFSQHRLGDWNQITSRYAGFSAPFILADSTSGSSRFNAIRMTGAYAWIPASERGTVSALFNYAVDEGLKEINPKPLSAHRELDVHLGTVYRAGLGWSAGIHGRFDSRMEELRYSEYDGAVDQETILIKYRGYDSPVVVRSKTDSRQIVIQDAEAGLQLRKDLALSTNVQAQLGAFGTWGQEFVLVEENLSLPREVGFLQRSYHRLGGEVSIRTVRFLSHSVFQSGNTSGWAEFVPFNTIVAENEQSGWQIMTAISNTFANDQLWLRLSGHIASRSVIYDDYFSDLNWQADQQLLRAGMDARWTTARGIAIELSGFFTKRDVTHNPLSSAGSSWFDFRKQDILFEYASWEEVSGSVRLSVPLAGQRTVSVLGTLANLSGDGLRRNQNHISVQYHIPLSP